MMKSPPPENQGGRHRPRGPGNWTDVGIPNARPADPSGRLLVRKGLLSAERRLLEDSTMLARSEVRRAGTHGRRLRGFNCARARNLHSQDGFSCGGSKDGPIWWAWSPRRAAPENRLALETAET